MVGRGCFGKGDDACGVTAVHEDEVAGVDAPDFARFIVDHR